MSGGSIPQVNLEEVLKASFLSFMSSIHTCLPGKIVNFNALTGKADVKPLIKLTTKSGEVLSRAVITNVPVVFPSAVNSGVEFNLEKNDPVLIIFSQRSLDRWLSSDGITEVEPGFPRKFDLTDGIAIPGLFPPKGRRKIKSDESLVVYDKSSKVILKKNGEIHLQSGSINLTVLDGVMTGACINEITGVPFINKSSKVKASLL